MPRISLREMLVLMAFVALAIVSLVYASVTWLAIVIAVTMLSFFAAIIVAAVDRGRRQAFAIGFSLVLIGYWLVVLNTNRTQDGGNREFDFMEGRLPTTHLMRYLHAGINRSVYIDYSTGKAVANFDPIKSRGQLVGGGGFGGGVGYREILPREVFMPIAHCWWSLLLGVSGGWFATCVYSRRERERASLAS